MRKAKRQYRGNEIDHSVTSVLGDLMQAWVSDEPLVCANPRCQASIPVQSLFTCHKKHWFDIVWRTASKQPYCRTCVPFYEADGAISKVVSEPGGDNSESWYEYKNEQESHRQ